MQQMPKKTLLAWPPSDPLGENYTLPECKALEDTLTNAYKCALVLSFNIEHIFSDTNTIRMRKGVLWFAQISRL